MQIATFCLIHTVPINWKPYPGVPERLKGVFVERRYNSRQDVWFLQRHLPCGHRTHRRWSRECPYPHLVD